MAEKSKPKSRPSLARNLYAVLSHLHPTADADLVEAVARHELSLAQLKLLGLLARAESPLNAKGLARASGTTPSNISRLLDQLVSGRYIERIDDEQDARAKRILLTPRGRETIDELACPRVEAIQRFTGTLDKDERRVLSAAVGKLCERDEIAARRPSSPAD